VGARRLLVQADGGSRGNPGPAGYGAVVKDAATGDVLVEVAAAIGTATNNVAEYGGLLAGLRAAAEIDPEARVEVRMDSKLVVEQMSGRWKIKHENMRRLAMQARDAMPYENVTYTWVPRAENSHADRLANEAMDAAARGERWTAASGPASRSLSGGGSPSETGRRDPAPTGDHRPVTSYAGDLAPDAALDLLRNDPSAVLVDCRTEAEWGYVGVPDLSEIGKHVVLTQWQRSDGAVNPRFVDELRAEGVTEQTPVVFICRSGVRSVAAAKAATAAGLGPAYNVLEGFEGGLDAFGHRGATGWKARGLPWRQS
jgi:ribonuclease H / adenosylcobalamin/alpha-ribazole phosphatase